jgi:glycosyltransferase involved in cell wall biosynthesis
MVSVVVAAYNAERFIATAIDSVLRQTYSNIELIVVNDASTDSTADIVRSYLTDGRNIRLFDMPNNQGVSAARNMAIEAAAGEWIAILDADDRFAPTRIEVLLRFAQQTGVDMVADNLELREFETDLPLGPAFPESWMSSKEEVTTEFLLERDLPGLYRREIGFMKPLLRRRFLVESKITYATDIWAGEDFLLYMECLLHGAQFRLLNEQLYIYGVRRGSASYHRRANVELVKGNRRLLDVVGPKAGRSLQLLEFRGMLLKFEIFKWHCEERRWAAAFRSASGIPASYLLAKIGHAAMRRFGIERGNATEVAFRRMKPS